MDKKITYYAIAVRLSSIFRYSQGIGKGKLVENKFKVTVDGPWMNAQFCPFTLYSDHNASPFESIKNPCSMANLDITITNVESGRSIKFSSLLPHLIHMHHFFEGRVPHRLAPLDIIETLEIPSETNFIIP
ncbi:MAG: hypothetical protein H0W50_04880 [Parachlamydiaceae bacterium]|nr:hypothetical protein [Parachlamydiaceae bacterium]